MDKVKAAAVCQPYVGPSESAWKRRAYGWVRAGVFSERLKKVTAQRRAARESARKEQLDADPERADMEGDDARSAYRRYRRRQQEHPHEGCRFVGPPRRARHSKERKKKRKMNWKENRALRAVRQAAYQTLSYRTDAAPLALAVQECMATGSGSDLRHIESMATPSAPSIDSACIKKHSRRGGKAARRQKASTDRGSYVNPKPKWLARPN